MSIDYTQQPRIATFGAMSYSCPEPEVLPNGTRIYVVDGGAQDINRIEVAYGGGTFDEPKPMTATLTSSMIVHGSDTYASQDVAEKLDFYGSWFGSRCTDNHSIVTLHSLNRCLADTLPMLVDIVCSPAFPEKEYELVRGKMRNAYRTARMKVRYRANVEASRLFFGTDHPLARDIRDSHIDDVTIDDLRRFHGRYYHPANCTLLLSGRIGGRELDMVTELFGKVPQVREAEPLARPAESRSESRFSIVDCGNVVQAGISMFMPAIPRSHPDYIKLRVLVMALGGYFGSRLMSNVREDKGYTYGITASLLGRISGAHIAIATECDNSYVGALIDEVRREMELLRTDLIPDDELMMVKSYIMSDLVKMFDTPFSLASYVGSTLFFGVSPDYFDRQVEQLRQITAADLREMAGKYLNPADATIAVAGDRSKIEPTLNRLF